MIHKILSIDNVTYSLQAWSEAHPPGGFQWTVQSIFTNKTSTNVHQFISTSTADTLISTWSQISDSRYTILDIWFVKENNVHLFMWLSHVQTTINKMISNNQDLIIVSIWIPLDSLPHILHNQALSLPRPALSPTWTLAISLLWIVNLVTQ